MIIRVINNDGSIQWEKEIVVSQPPVTPTTFPCTKCSAYFTSQALLDAHIKVAHPTPIDPPVPPPAGYTAILGYAQGGKNFGAEGMIVPGQPKGYSINLKDGLPVLPPPNNFGRTVEIPAGTNYREFEINVVDMTQTGTLKISVIDPKGVTHAFPPPSQNLYYLKFQNQRPAYPGRYLLTIESTTPTTVSISVGSKPGMVQSELTK